MRDIEIVDVKDKTVGTLIAEMTQELTSRRETIEKARSDLNRLEGALRISEGNTKRIIAVSAQHVADIRMLSLRVTANEKVLDLVRQQAAEWASYEGKRGGLYPGQRAAGKRILELLCRDDVAPEDAQSADVPREPHDAIMRPRANSGIQRRWHAIDPQTGRNCEGFVVAIPDLPCVPRLLGVTYYEGHKERPETLAFDILAWDWKDWRRFTHHYAFVPAGGGFSSEAQGHAVITDDDIPCFKFPGGGTFYVFPLKQTTPDPDNAKRRP
jgi:hypothetical protein